MRAPRRDPYPRHESEAERLDRNFNELLQELRIAQTGVQILFAFLLGIAFQQRFSTTSNTERGIYIAALLCTGLATALLIAPVAFHRVLFRQHAKDELVVITSRLAMAGLSFLLLAVLAGVLLILDVVLGIVPAVAVTAVLGVVFACLWIMAPLALRARDRRNG